MRRNSTLSVCVMFVSAIACAACSDDTNDTTSSGTTGANDSTNNQASGTTSGGASGTSGNGRTSNNTDSTIGPNDDGTTGQNTSTVRLTDPEIASVSMTANQGEVDQNTIALMRAQSEEARSFAQDMVDMHTAALEREMNLAASTNVAPADNSITQMLKSTSDKMVAMLQNASDDDFDQLYLRGQVQAHEMTLSLIDNTLLPSAQAQPLKDELTMMRGTVVEHLDRVRDLAGQD